MAGATACSGMRIRMTHATATPSSCSRLCRLLWEPDPALSSLPGEWLGSLLDAAAAPKQTVDNIIRRSAGGPFAVTAILLAEPAQQTQKAGACSAQVHADWDS